MDLPGHEGEIQTPVTSTYVSHNTALNKTTEDQAPLSKTVVAKVVKYRECLKNHAASMGGNATDGCGEFMPSGEEGTLESFKCSACNCHRNFHRKEVEGEPFSCSNGLFHCNYKGRYMPMPQPPPALIMPLGAIHSSASDEIGEGYHFGIGGEMVRAPPISRVKKRVRTRLTQEQKEKMLSFAEKAGWKLQRQEEGSVQQFCQEIGVKRRVLKVWMHNNKHSLTKKNSLLQIDQ